MKQLLVTGLRLDRPVGDSRRFPISGDGLGLTRSMPSSCGPVEDRFAVSILDEEVGKRAFASVRSLVDFIATERG